MSVSALDFTNTTEEINQILHSNLPSIHHGEKEFAEKILKIINPKSKIWFNRCLSGLTEIDVFLLHPDAGALLIEVKAVTLEAIKEFSLDSVKISGREEKSHMLHPIDQAKQSIWQLKTKYKDSGFTAPWFIATAAFPKIKRKELLSCLNKGDCLPRELEQEINSMLFAEDLENSQTLNSRIINIAKNPPRSKAYPVKNYEEIVKSTFAILGEKKPTDRLQFSVSPGKSRKESIQKFILPGNRKPIVLNGLPGSGKTQALLDIAAGHAKYEKKVLFTCFNKVLATKLRHDLDTLGLDNKITQKIIVADFFDLKQAIKDYPDSIPKFDTICIDESQDIVMKNKNNDWIAFLKNLATPNAEWFFAYGRDQELYGEAPKIVLDALNDPECVQELRRTNAAGADGYRESLFAQASFDVMFDPAKAERAAKAVFEKIQNDKNFSDSLVSYGKKAISITSLPEFPDTEDYRKIIEEELQILEKLDAKNDLLILFPLSNPQASEVKQVKAALTQIQLPFHDQVDSSREPTDKRRERLPEGYIRLATVHSSRGLEATRVLLFAPHELKYCHNDNNDSFWKPAAPYIALSRAMHGTKVVEQLGRERSELQNFIHNFKESYKQLVWDSME